MSYEYMAYDDLEPPRAVDTLSVEFIEQARRGLFAWYVRGTYFDFLCNIADRGTGHRSRQACVELTREFLLANPNIRTKYPVPQEGGFVAWAVGAPYRRVAALAMYHWLGAVVKRRLKEGSL